MNPQCNHSGELPHSDSNLISDHWSFFLHSGPQYLYKYIEREREREKEETRKREVVRVSILWGGGGKTYISSFGGSLPVPVHPPHRGNAYDRNEFFYFGTTHYIPIWSDIQKATLEGNFDVTIGKAVCEACCAPWNLCINSAFALVSR
jgi:hypothetical protein